MAKKEKSGKKKYEEGINNEGTDYKNADNEGTNFKDADSKGTNSKDADNEGTNFKNVDSKGTHFKDADNKGTHFKDADYEDTDYEDEFYEYGGFDNELPDADVSNNSDNPDEQIPVPIPRSFDMKKEDGTESDDLKKRLNEKKIKNDEWTKQKLTKLAGTFYDQFQEGIVPHVLMPSRTKKNLEYSDESEVWVYGDIESERSAKTVKGAHQLLRTVFVSDFVVREHIKNNRGSTLRELYYISEGWGAAKFHAQQESDRLIEDLEIITGAQREYFHIRPEEDGATMYGPILIREETKRGTREIHCQQDIGEGGYQIPFNVENIDFLKHDASMIVAVETGGMYARLVENGFDERYNAILVHLKGQPARSTRRIIRRMNTELGIPAVVFTDGDPWSYRIFSSIAYGAIKSAHLSEYMATPDAKFIGVQPSDIVEYELATDKLSEQDIAALRSELTDPRFDTDYWRKQINLQLEIGKKAEQQAFAGKGLDFVTETYLPKRLKELGII